VHDVLQSHMQGHVQGHEQGRMASVVRRLGTSDMDMGIRMSIATHVWALSVPRCVRLVVTACVNVTYTDT